MSVVLCFPSMMVIVVVDLKIALSRKTKGYYVGLGYFSSTETFYSLISLFDIFV